MKLEYGEVETMKHVIIGAGPAGLTAAKTIRGLRQEDEIVVISTDQKVYGRNMLLRYLSGEKTAEKINFVEPDFFEKYQVRWISGQGAEEIYPEPKEVLLSDGSRESYDRLLIASGARPSIPPVEHLRDASGVFVFRDMPDADAILEEISQGCRVAVIGSGLVGMDVTEALLHRGCQVTVVEMADRIIPLQLDQEAAARYQKAFEERGASFFLQAKVESCLIDSDSHARGILLADGRNIDCDIIVVAAGVRPNFSFAKSSVKSDRGVTVNEHMMTSLPDIFAAGDVTGLTGTWLCAVEQGKVAGENMAGKDSVYQNAYPPRNGLNYYGIMSLAIGDIFLDGGTYVVKREEKSYQRGVVLDGVLRGMLLVGNIAKGNAWTKMISEGKQVPADEELFSMV